MTIWTIKDLKNLGYLESESLLNLPMWTETFSFRGNEPHKREVSEQEKNLDFIELFDRTGKSHFFIWGNSEANFKRMIKQLFGYVRIMKNRIRTSKRRRKNLKKGCVNFQFEEKVERLTREKLELLVSGYIQRGDKIYLNKEVLKEAR